MQKEDWARVAKMIGYVYLPIALLVIFVFLLIQYEDSKIERKKAGVESATMTTETNNKPNQ